MQKAVLLLYCLMILAVASYIDIKTRKIPNSFIFPILILAFIYGCILSQDTRIIKIIFFALCLLLSAIPGLGMGDVKLILCIGLIGSPFWTIVDVAIASTIIVVIHRKKALSGIVNLYCERKLQNPYNEKTKENSIPFAPYLLIAYVLTEGGKLLLCLIN